jgi:ferric-dicitrate binding protein FerR (iron transport regulator)
MSNADFNELLNRYLNDSLSVDELKELLTHLQKQENTAELRQVIQQALQNNAFKELSDKTRTDLVFQKIMQQARQGPDRSEPGTDTDASPGRKKLFVWLPWIAAAAVLTGVFIGAYFMFIKSKPANTLAVAEKRQAAAGDRAPGGNKAFLQLADGSLIALDDTDTGMLAQQGNTKIVKLNNGRLKYNCLSQKNTQVLYNTISTPRGGQYHVILPDGSKVWLNAASSLRFPTSFTDSARNVQLTGEAYFEVAPLAPKGGSHKIPFVVMIGDKGNVEVLGTHFNINAYDNEGMMKTTLLEGKVSVSQSGIANAKSTILKPGEQALLVPNSPLTIHNSPDLDQVVAWKNGLFQFDNADIQTIMRQIERWYDVDVHYKGPIPQGHYSGIVPRGNNLLKVLRIFEESDLKFSIEGKTLNVL